MFRKQFDSQNSNVQISVTYVSVYENSFDHKNTNEPSNTFGNTVYFTERTRNTDPFMIKTKTKKSSLYETGASFKRPSTVVLGRSVHEQNVENNTRLSQTAITYLHFVTWRREKASETSVRIKKVHFKHLYRL